MIEITCTYNTPCTISVENYEEQKVLKLDFNIKAFKIFNQGWHDYDFPEDIIIHDKLFLNADLKDALLECLDAFIKTGDLSEISVETTERGFSLLNMKDIQGNVISLQESSSAMEPKIWFGCELNNSVYMLQDGVPYEFPVGDVLISDRLHLNKKKARQLKKAIISEWGAKNKPRFSL